MAMCWGVHDFASAWQRAQRLAPLLRRWQRRRDAATQTLHRAGMPTALVEENFTHVAMALVETCLFAQRPAGWFLSQSEVVGELEGQLQSSDQDAQNNQNRQSQQGTVFVLPHTTCMEVAGIVLNHAHPLHISYARPHNRAFSRWQLDARLRHQLTMINRDHVREMMGALKKGGNLWIAPDQYATPNHGGIPSRFFNRETLTTNGPARLAQRSGARLQPCFPYRDMERQRWVVELSPALDTSQSAQVLTQTINEVFEAQIRRFPAQYLWMHRRFRD